MLQPKSLEQTEAKGEEEGARRIRAEGGAASHQQDRKVTGDPPAKLLFKYSLCSNYETQYKNRGIY